MKALTFVFALALLLPASSQAGAWSGNCQFSGGDLVSVIGTPLNTNTKVDTGNIGCYRFNNADSTHNSALFSVAAESAVITFDPQLDAAVAAATTALVIMHACPQGTALTVASPQLSCGSIGGANGAANLDGTEGAATTQNASIRVGPGVYYIQVSGACLAGDTCQVAVKGEGTH